MNRLTRTLPIFLAVALQILPLVRNFFLNPATGSNIAFILRWGIGTSAALGAYDSISRASAPVIFTNPTNFYGTVGIYFTNNVAITNNGANSGAYFILNNATILTGQLKNGMSTTSCMPNGLTFTVHDLNNGDVLQPIYCSISGTPTTPGTNIYVHILAGYTNQTPAATNFYFTIYPAAASTIPVITNQPVSKTNVAGANATFSVTAGGVPAPAYQWRLLSTAVPGATNALLTLTNARASQAGNYTVVITNTAGSVTSSVTSLVITNPLPPAITAPTQNGNLFQFTFNPVVGLTNSVMTNSAVNGGVWSVLTNVPPPANANPVTVSDAIGSSNRFYRVLVVP